MNNKKYNHYHFVKNHKRLHDKTDILLGIVQDYEIISAQLMITLKL